MKLSENALEIIRSRYFIDENEDWQKLAIRVGSEAARFENGKSGEYRDKFAEIIFEGDFLAGGRILRNMGRPRGSLFNCYVLPVGDSRKEIGQWLCDSLILWGEGGGVGCNLSFLRPRGAPIKGVGGVSSGPVSFLEASDAVAKTVESGGSRRAAALGTMIVTHPDIMEFIDAKITHGKLPHYNISVAVTEDFLEAVEKNVDWEFKFAQQSFGTTKARDIWDKVVSNMVQYAEPGLLNWDNLRSNNSYYFDPILSTNPCVVGSTLVYTADGRRYVSIKSLADEGKDVPVFCFNELTKKPEVKMMRRPRLTGVNKKIFKVTLDDGSVVRCTENHEFYMKDGSKKRADKLCNGDRLHHMVSYDASFEEIFKHSNSKSQDYRWLNTDFSNTVSEHRLAAAFGLGRDLKADEIVHHKDRNGLNNIFKNIEVMTKEAHDELHVINMFGTKNPMNRFPEKNWLVKQDWSAKNNGRYMGFTPDDVFNLAITYSKKINRRITDVEWREYCLKNSIPYSRYSIGNFSSFNKMLKSAAEVAEVFVYKNSSQAKEYKRFLNLKNNTDLDIFFDGVIKVRKRCEYCNEEFIINYSNREICFCSIPCANRAKDSKAMIQTKTNKQLETRIKQLDVFRKLNQDLDREPFKKEWEVACKNLDISHRIRTVSEKNYNEYCFSSYKEIKECVNLNFKVISVEEDGYEDVYNGTVEDNHNFYSMTSVGETKSGKIKYNHILNRQCGEVPLSAYGVCCLGSLVLPNFITGSVNTNWKKLEQTIRLAVRFLDNIIDVNKYTLQEVDVSAHNSRRIGLGVMGLAEYLFAKKLRYGSKKAIDEVENLMKFIRNVTYESSVELAVEKGAFPKFDSVQFGKAHFIRSLPAALRMSIKDKGIRNVTLMAMAPTGTISLIPEVSSGIEPIFAKAYMRNDRVSDRMYVHPFYKQIIISGEETPEWFVDSFDLKPSDHFETQAIVQKYTDGAVSKTINMPKNTTQEDLSRLTLEYIRDLKGVTVYVDGSREGQILNTVSDAEVRACIKSGTDSAGADEASVRCSSGTCEL